MVVENDDAATLELLSTRVLCALSDECGTVLLYASCQQFWQTRGDRRRRVLVSTDVAVYLTLDDPAIPHPHRPVQLLEAVPWRRCREVAQSDANPRELTLTFAADRNPLRRYRTWRLSFETPRARNQALTELRKRVPPSR